MANVFKRFGSMIIAVLGFCFGKWLWDEILKEKFDKIKKKLSEKD